MEKQKLNPTLVYVLAIIGLLCCCFAGLGFILAGIAFFIAHSKLKQVQINPDDYEVSSVKAMNTAKTVALIILIINILYFFYAIYNIYAIGGWDAYMEQVQEMMEQMQNQ
ncbi:CCC motif membrane protein [Hanstruepera marina]|uniref:CCC motif membrane protein n=1 Tax=Hanstruepera marina TaxID=2873265 RepID=UPI001CA6DC29|nr:CCC motif membrane protein [Hanstruepera marina]